MSIISDTRKQELSPWQIFWVEDGGTYRHLGGSYETSAYEALVEIIGDRSEADGQYIVVCHKVMHGFTVELAPKPNL